jgi:hypothetical protein
MSLAALSVLPLRLTRVTFSLLVLALAALLLPATARAQTITAGGAITFTTSDSTAQSSTVSVSGAPGPVATVKVTLSGVHSNGSGNDQSMGYAEFLLQSPSGAQFVVLGSTGDGVDGGGLNGLNIAIQDGATAAPELNPWSATGSVTVKPSSYFQDNFSTPPPLPASENTSDYPQNDGTGTLNGKFNGVGANGTWTLYLIDNDAPVDPVSITGWTLALTYGTATTTATTLGSSANPAFYVNSASTASITYTATVSPSSATGTVAFQANGATISGCASVAVSSGVAHCTVSLAQGNYGIAAQYTPTGVYGQSSSSLEQLVEVTPANPSGDQWCNNRLISDPAADNIGLVYPSIIGINDSSYNGKTVGNVTVELEGLQGTAGIAGQYMLVAPGGTKSLVFLQEGWFNDSGSTSAVNLIFDDTASGTVPYTSGSPTTGTYLPTDNNEAANLDSFQTSISPSVDSGVPQVPGTLNFAPPYGSDTVNYTHTNVLTFAEAFDGASANGKWALYSVSPGTTTLNSGWCITLSLNTGVSTTTTVTPSSNPATTGQSVTFTAAVTSGGSPVIFGGTVTFQDNGVAPAGTVSGNNVVALNGSAVATFTTSSLTQGDHPITANYSGTSSDNESFSAVLHQRINTATTAASVSSNTWSYCDPGAVQIQGGANAGPLTPNPSVISVANLPGTLKTVSVTLNGFSVLTTYGLEELASLVEGPTGAALDFFSNTTQGANGNGQASLGAYTFEDSAAGYVSAGNTNISPGNYKPTAYLNFLSTPDVFTSSPSGFYNVPSFSYAPSHGSSTFANIFTNGSNANGNWSLFFSSGNANATFGAANGWCVNLTENLPTVSVDASHNGAFAQGEQNAQLTVAVTNDGPGSTGDPSGSNPMTVTDTLGAAFTYSTYSGTGWNCSASSQLVTCTNDTAIGSGIGYPTLTIDVNVSGTATGTVINSATASGAGVSSTSSPNDSITIDVPPSITSGSSTTFTVGTAGSFTVTATGSPAPSFSFGSTGPLPNGVSMSSGGVLSGTPLAGTGGSYTIFVTASNGAGTAATQTLTLTVDQAPAINSAASTTFTVGTAGSFTVTASGYPSSMTFTETGTLPSGVTLTTAGVLSGTPAAGTGNSYPITITANNGTTNTTQTFTLVVNQAPMFNLGATGSDTMAVDTPNIVLIFTSGYPSAAISESGTLPSGVTFLDNGNGHGTLSGEPGATTGGLYNLVLTASNGVSPSATLNYALTVKQPIAFTSSASTTFTTGTAGSFSVTTTGYPSPTFSETGALPSGVAFTDNGNGTASLAGTPAAGTGGTYAITISATNGSSTPSQSFTLTVDQAPAISSANTTTFTVGTNGSFTVIASGYPTSTTFSETGALPSGVTLTTAGLLSGTPAAGTGGSYPITITAANGTTNATQSFTLTVDQAPVATTLTINGGTPQSTEVTDAFASPLSVTLTDNYGNPVAGQTITFTAPASGASAVLSTSIPTNQYGLTTVLATANHIAGAYTVTATFNSISASFSLTNNPPPGYVVTTALDDATGTPANCPAGNSPPSINCSLRDALAAAATNSVGDITFDSGTFNNSNSTALNTITLANGTLTVPPNTTITGPTSSSGYTLANLVTVAGGGLSSDFPVFTVNNDLTDGAVIANLTITQGNSGTGGGIAIGFGSVLTVTGCTISGNTSTGGAAAIFNDYNAVLTVIGSTIAGNTGDNYGGIVNEGGGTVTVNSSTISNNIGKGIINGGTTFTVNASTISGNAGAYGGGGIDNDSGVLILANSIVAGNTAITGGDINGSYTDNSGNVVGGSVSLALLGNYGGPTQTQLPAPDSAAICAGTLANATAASLTTDQRGFGFDPKCPSGFMDAGSVQTSYALAFSIEPPSLVATGLPIEPAPALTLTESGIPATAATNSITVTDSASLLGGTTMASLVAGTATFSNLLLPSVVSGDTLTATLALNQSTNLTAQSTSFEALDSPATLTSPTPGSTLTSSTATFGWTSGTGVTKYEFRLGTTGPGSSDVYNSAGAATTALSTGAVTVPTNGGTLFARLYSMIDGAWQHSDYTYIESGTPAAAILNSPTVGSTLTGSSVSFGWTSGTGVTKYEFRLGTTGPGSSDVYNAAGATTTALNTGAVTVPTNGGTLFARIYSLIDGAWQHNDYTYTAK